MEEKEAKESLHLSSTVAAVEPRGDEGAPASSSLPTTKLELAVEEEEEEEEGGRGDGGHRHHRGHRGHHHHSNHVMGTSLSWPFGITNFHFGLCVGIVGFLVFWLVLLLRIYLPEEMWHFGEREKRQEEEEERT